MTKCCSHTIYEHKLKHTTSRIKRFQITAQFYWIMFKIYVYQTLLTCDDWFRREENEALNIKWTTRLLLY